MDLITQWLQSLAGFLWGLPLIVLLVGGGIYFSIISRLQPYRYFGHAIAILRGRVDQIFHLHLGADVSR
jgi:AGCS family alanine or glycine:cation symporter